MLRCQCWWCGAEEEAVIQLQTLSEQLREARTAESQTALKSRIVEFHGQSLC
jgi:hypothetical protein